MSDNDPKFDGLDQDFVLPEWLTWEDVNAFFGISETPPANRLH